MADKKADKKKELKEKTGGLVEEFKQFIARGNVVDMAVGVIIGGAFGTISTSLVNDVIMPLLSLLTGGLNFDNWKLVLREAVTEEGEVVSEAVTLNYGALLSAILNFLIVAFAIFLMIKTMNAASERAARLARLKKEEKKEPEKAPEPSREEQLLTEIRDLLRAGAEPPEKGKPKKAGKKKS